MADDALFERLVAVSDRLWDDGCPVARDSRRAAEIALLRWRTFDQRTGRRSATIDDRVEYLAKGLCDGLEPEPALAGPLIEDYRHLARALANVFTS